MLNTEHYVVLAGKPEKWDEEMKKRCRPGRFAPGTFHSDDLCRVQSDQYSRGRRAAALVKSIYGWYVCDDSGLSGNAVLASCKVNPNRPGVLDGTIEDAVRWGKVWANEDPEHREFYANKDDLLVAMGL